MIARPPRRPDLLRLDWLDVRLTARCPLPRCSRVSRDPRRGGLCAAHFTDPRAGHDFAGRGRYGNLTPKETAR